MTCTSLFFGGTALAVTFLVIAVTSSGVAANGRDEGVDAEGTAPTPLTREFRDCEQCPPMIEVIDPRENAPPIAIARHELIWAEYLPAVFEADCPLPEVSPGGRYPQNLTRLADNMPLTYLPPTQIGCYLDWLNNKTGQTYRLPSGDEWEFFARAGAATRYPWGDEPGTDMAAVYGWFDVSKFPRSRFSQRSPYRLSDPRHRGSNGFYPVEQFPPNRFGLFEVIGNVNEYIADERPPWQPCVERFSAERCRLILVRGGGFNAAYHWENREGPAGGDPNLLEIEDAQPFRFAQPTGYRFVRELNPDELTRDLWSTDP